jgi:hypothetical protein
MFADACIEDVCKGRCLEDDSVVVWGVVISVNLADGFRDQLL